MKTDTVELHIGSLSPRVLVHQASTVPGRILRRLGFMLLDTRQLYRFYTDGYKISITRRGWCVEFRKCN